MSQADPLVTVIATCFNHRRFVVECLESIRCQTYPNIQLIVVDDRSTDGSQALISDWLNQTKTPAEFQAHRKNMGICRSRNQALRQARGKYVACISTDDVWLPDKLEVQTALMEHAPDDTAVLYSDVFVMDESGKRLDGMFIERHRTFATPPQGSSTYDQLIKGNFLPSLGTLIRRRALKAVGPYDSSLAFEDWDMWLRLSERFAFQYSPVPSANYRVVSTSLIHDLHGSRRAALSETEVRIRLKHTGLSPEADNLLSFPITADLDLLYRAQHPARCELYRRARACGCSQKTFDLCRLASAGLPCAWWHRLSARMLRRQPVQVAVTSETSLKP